VFAHPKKAFANFGNFLGFPQKFFRQTKFIFTKRERTLRTPSRRSLETHRLVKKEVFMLAIQKCHHRPQCSLGYRADQIVSVLNN
jgi:hypothetical protein